MAPMMRRRVDDDDLYDDDGNGPYDKRYPGRRVVADGGRVRVPIELTDGMPDWMPPRRALYDASAHRPRFAVVDRADPAVRAAEASYEAHRRWLADAWRGPGNPPPPAPRPGEFARDAYIRNLKSAYRTPPGQDPDDDDDDDNNADAIEALQRRWASPGATPGPSYRDAASTTTRGALADRAAADAAYAEYVARISNAWKTR